MTSLCTHLQYLGLAFGLAVFANGANAEPSDGISADVLLMAADQALEKIDKDDAGELWDGAPAFVKAAKTKSVFVDEIRRARSGVGVVSSRSWANVTRLRFPDAANAFPPGGLYANVDYSTNLSNGQVLFEKVSFRWESAGWKLTGYEPRKQQ